MIDFVVGLVEERADSGGFRFLNQVSNAGTLQLLHSRMRYAWNVEVNVLLNSFTN